jgi:hypothetical protein
VFQHFQHPTIFEQVYDIFGRRVEAAKVSDPGGTLPGMTDTGPGPTDQATTNTKHPDWTQPRHRVTAEQNTPSPTTAAGWHTAPGTTESTNPPTSSQADQTATRPIAWADP